METSSADSGASATIECIFCIHVILKQMEKRFLSIQLSAAIALAVYLCGLHRFASNEAVEGFMNYIHSSAPEPVELFLANLVMLLLAAIPFSLIMLISSRSLREKLVNLLLN